MKKGISTAIFEMPPPRDGYFLSEKHATGQNVLRLTVIVAVTVTRTRRLETLFKLLIGNEHERFRQSPEVHLNVPACGGRADRRHLLSIGPGASTRGVRRFRGPWRHGCNLHRRRRGWRGRYLPRHHCSLHEHRLCSCGHYSPCEQRGRNS